MNTTLALPPVSLLRFCARQSELALDARHLRLVTTTAMTHVLKDDDISRGLIGWYEGKAIPVVDIGQPAGHGAQLRPMLILKLQRLDVAIIVDEVKGLVKLPAQAIKVLSETDIDPGNLIHGIFNAECGRVLVLDVERFFTLLLYGAQ